MEILCAYADFPESRGGPMCQTLPIGLYCVFCGAVVFLTQEITREILLPG